MPYNNAAIPPRHEATGTTQLPLSRIKKIIGTDQDINMCSNNAAFVITLATEMFIQYMAESGHNVVKSERKPRRNIQYRDLSSAVSHIDNLEFLSDIIPRTVPLKVVKARAHTANTLIQAQPTNPPSSHPAPPPPNPLSGPSTTHAGPSGTNTFPPPLDTAPPRVSVSGLLDSASRSPSQPTPPPPALNQIQIQPQPQTPTQTQPHPNTIPIIHTNGFTPANANTFTPANKPQKQQQQQSQKQRRTSSGTTTGTSAEEEDPNAQLRMESQANSDGQEDVEMS